MSPIRESPDFRVLWLSQTFSFAGRQIVIVAMAYQVYVLTGSSLAVGLLGFFQIGPIILAGLYGGPLADRYDRRKVQFVARAIVATGSVALALGAREVRWSAFIYSVAAITAAASAVDEAAFLSTIPRIVGRQFVSSAMAVTQMSTQVAAIAGPAVAGLVIGFGGVAWAYIIDAALYVPAATFLWFLSAQPALSGKPVPIGWRAPAEAFRFVGRQRIVLGVFMADLVAMVFGMPTALFPALALSVFHFGPFGLGLLYAAPAAGALAASALSGWIRSVSRQGLAVFWAIAIWGLAIAGFGIAGSTLWIALPLLAIAGGADLISTVLRSTMLQLSTPDSLRGRMSAFHSMMATAGPRLGDLEAGGVAALVNPVFSVVSGGLACVVGIAFMALLIPEMRRQRLSLQEPSTE